MDRETLLKYAPVLIVILTFVLQYHIFVTPEQLEIKHREILMEVSDMYTTKDQYNDLKEQLNDLQKKIDKIYDIVTSTRRN